MLQIQKQIIIVFFLLATTIESNASNLPEWWEHELGSEYEFGLALYIEDQLPTGNKNKNFNNNGSPDRKDGSLDNENEKKEPPRQQQRPSK